MTYAKPMRVMSVLAPPRASEPRPVEPRPASGREPAATVLARNLVLARHLAALTQHDLATKSGVSRATIAQLESGASDPRLSTIVDLALALGVSPLVLISGRHEVTALAGLAGDLSARPVRMTEQDVAKMRAFAGSPLHRDRASAARIGASIARAAGGGGAGAAVTAGVFSVAVPGGGTAVGAAFGRLLG